MGQYSAGCVASNTVIKVSLDVAYSKHMNQTSIQSHVSWHMLIDTWFDDMLRGVVQTACTSRKEAKVRHIADNIA